MADDPQKTVFISYRRSISFGIARAIFMDLRDNDYDTFMDVASLDSGTFDTIILNQIAARAHFLVILEPGTLDRCAEPGDWLRREIEYAIDLGRNIVPVMVESFKFDALSRQHFTGKLSDLPRYNALPLVHFYFDEGMRRLRETFLKRLVYGPIIPTPHSEEAIVQQKIEEVIEQSKPKKELRAKEYFSRGYARVEQGDFVGGIDDYTEAILLDPTYAEAYNNRGIARRLQGDLAGAIDDSTRSLELNNPELHLPYTSRGISYEKKGDYLHALADYDAALRIDPQFELARKNRSRLLKKMGRA